MALNHSGPNLSKLKRHGIEHTHSTNIHRMRRPSHQRIVRHHLFPIERTFDPSIAPAVRSSAYHLLDISKSADSWGERRRLATCRLRRHRLKSKRGAIELDARNLYSSTRDGSA